MRIYKRIIIAYLYQIADREIHIEKLAEKLKGGYSKATLIREIHNLARHGVVKIDKKTKQVRLNRTPYLLDFIEKSGILKDDL